MAQPFTQLKLKFWDPAQFMDIISHQHNQAVDHHRLQAQNPHEDLRQNLKAVHKHLEKLRQKEHQKHHAKKDTNEEKNEDKV